jgi:hypothetical protein
MTLTLTLSRVECTHPGPAAVGAAGDRCRSGSAEAAATPPGEKRLTAGDAPSLQERTVYVGNITASITEETLLALFAHCGQVTNVRISGYVPNPSSALAGDGRGRCST